MPAVYWRFDGGLQEAPAPPFAPPPPPPSQQIMQGWNCVQNYPAPWAFPPYQPWQGYPQWQPPPEYVPGPVYIKGLRLPPPEYKKLSPPPPGFYGNLLPSPPKLEKKEGKKDDAKAKDEKKEKPKKENRNAPPKMPGGCNYMFDKHHTMVHIFNKASPIWDDKYKGVPLKFKMFKISVNFTVKMIIENVLRDEGDACKGWAATEVVEVGGGKWIKGSTVEYDSGKSDGKLKDMSWSEKRGDKLPPVWLVIHKV